uniref:Ig-like domain-containing protein n=1 Tax=Oncorhynchus tshawytscha TaxID=74940 RepID=A0A8C8JY64_ONCTS
QTELTQPGSMILQPGQPLTLTCKVSGYSFTSTSYCTGVNHQPKGKSLDDKLKNKFSISRDTSSSTMTLTGQSLQTEDTALYYCARHPY